MTAVGGGCSDKRQGAYTLCGNLDPKQSDTFLTG
jgi:hypothetical protein